MDAFFRLAVMMVVACVLTFFILRWFKTRNQEKMAELITSASRDTEEEIHNVTTTAEQYRFTDSEPDHFIVEKEKSESDIPPFPMENVMEEPEIPPFPTSAEITPPPEPIDLSDDLIVINVIAKPGCAFASYDLFQAISATGMQFGAMNIFHFYEMTPAGKSTIFSLASATEPGEFDLDHIGDYSCKGLSLFMNLRQVTNAEDAFARMLDTAEQLAEDLEGDLHAGPHASWSEDIFKRYQEKVLSHQHLS